MNTTNRFEKAINHFNKVILEELQKEGIICWIAGGCLRDYFSRTPLTTDIDIFFPNESNRINAKLHMVKNGGEILYENDNSVKLLYKERKFDLIKKYFSSFL